MLNRKSPLTYEEEILQKQLDETSRAIESIAEEKSRKKDEEYADWLDANSPFTSKIYLGEMDCYE